MLIGDELLDLHRLGELVRWHIECGNLEPLEAEEDRAGDSSSDEPSGQEVAGAEEDEVDELDLKGTIMDNGAYGDEVSRMWRGCAVRGGM